MLGAGGSALTVGAGPGQAGLALRRLASEAGYASLAQELEALESRAQEGRFYAAVVGQYKRGKSTLVNALLGEPLLPTGVEPVTSVVTLLRHAAEPRVTVHYRHAPPAEITAARLSDFVTEAGNPGNSRSVMVVEIGWPSPLLASGLCLVDTPGVGSIFEANGRETHRFVPHVDAALLVLGADPPISAAEMDVVRALLVERPPLIVVINKADVLSREDLEVSVAFTRRTLQDVTGQEALVLVTSARAATEHRALSDGRPDGGLPDLRAALDALARSSGSALAQGALVRGTVRVRRALEWALTLERRALTEPAEGLARLEEALTAHLVRIENFLAEFSHRLAGALEAFGQKLEMRRDAFIETARADTPRMAEGAVLASEAWRSVRAEPAAEAGAWAELRSRLMRWEREIFPWVDARQRAVAERFTAEALQLLRDVQSEGGDLLGDVPLPDVSAPKFAPAARYYLAADADVALMDVSGIWRRLLHALLPEDVVRSRLQRRIAERLEEWARHNATRVSSEIVLAARDAGRAFEFDLSRTARDLDASARTALLRALDRRREHEAGTADELARLDNLLLRCRTLESSFAAGPAHPAPANG